MPGISKTYAGVLAITAAVGALFVGAAPASAATLTQKTQRCSGASVSHSARSDQTIEVLLPDGSSVLVAPGSAVSVRCDAQGVDISVDRGLARVAGGAANAAQPISIRTSDADLSLDAGSAVISTSPNGTRAHLLGGRGLTVRSDGRQERLYRPAFEVTVQDGAVSSPRRMSADEVLSDFTDLSPGLTTREAPDLRGDARPPARSVPNRRGATPAQDGGETVAEADGTEDTTTSPAESGENADDIADTGPSDGGDDLGDIDLADGSDPTVGDDVGSLPENNVTAFNVLPGFRFPTYGDGGGGTEIGTPELTFTEADYDAGLGTVDLAFGADPTLGIAVGNLTEVNSSVVDGNFVARLQETVIDQRSEGQFASYDEMTRRSLGPTTNVVHGTVNLTESLTSRPTFGASSGGLSYFSGSSVFGLKLANDEPLSDERGLFLFQLTNSLAGSGGVAPTGLVQNSVFTAASLRVDFDASTDSSFGAFGAALDDGSGNLVSLGRGAITTAMTFGAPFSDCGFICLSAPVRQADNFVFMDILAADAIKLTCGPGVDCSALIQTLAEAERQANGASEYLFTADVSSAAALIPDPQNVVRQVFAAGDLDGLANAPVQGASVDAFHLSAGMVGAVANGVNGLSAGFDTSLGARAFLRGATWTDLDPSGTFALDLADLGQSGLFVVHPDGNLLTTSNGNSKVVHLDYGLRTAGDGVTQVSTLALTLGNVTYRANPANTAEVDALIAAHTIGTARGLVASGQSESAVLLTGAVQSTAAGGGNPNLPQEGRLGFFVLENSGLTFDDIGGGGTLTAGQERPVGVDPVQGDDLFDDQSFSVLRLATGTGTSVLAARSGIPATLTGYVAGFVDVETDGAVQLGRLARADGAPQLSFTNFDTSTHSLRGQVLLDSGAITIGGAGGFSVYLDDDRFAARSDIGISQVALVSGDMAPGFLDDAPGGAPDTSGYQHLKWGYFIGDTVTTEGSRQHVNLGTFAAAPQITDAQWQSWLTGAPSGDIVYQGHMVGNVQSGQNVYTATGTVSDSFNFTSRTGSVTASFDGRTLTGPSAVLATSPAYSATLGPIGQASMGAENVFSGQMNGRFGALPGDGGAPQALTGAFSIQNQATTAGAYRATGTFGAER